MSMVTIRTTDVQHRQITEGAALAGKSVQIWALELMLNQARALGLQKLQNEDPPAVGMIRLFPFQDPEGWYDVPRTIWMPWRATEARQYQAGGDWYFEEPDRGVVGTWPDSEMRPLLPSPDLEHTLTMAS